MILNRLISNLSQHWNETHAVIVRRDHVLRAGHG